MKISQKLLCITVLIATMTLGISVAAGFRFASALVSSVVRAGNVASRAIPAAEIPASTNESAELIFESPTSIETDTDQAANDRMLDYSGEYYLGSEVPKPFADLDYLDLTTHEYNDVNWENVGRPIAPKGSVQTTTTLRFSRIAIGGRELSFQTETVDGVSYKFVGSFRDDRPETYCEIDEPQPDLVGKLIRIKNGKWAAEMKAAFYIACGC